MTKKRNQLTLPPVTERLIDKSLLRALARILHQIADEILRIVG